MIPLWLRFSVIPHRYQRYDSVGDYEYQAEDELWEFRASRMRPIEYSWLVFFHEIIEWGICKLTGVKMQAIDKFDMEYEKAREHFLEVERKHPEKHSNLSLRGGCAPCGCQFYEEPGDDPHAPYHDAHMTATLCEKAIARAIGVDWQAYGDTVAKL